VRFGAVTRPSVYNADLVGQLVRLLTADHDGALKGRSVTALDINADTLRLRSTRTPAAADAAGEAGGVLAGICRVTFTCAVATNT